MYLVYIKNKNIEDVHSQNFIYEKNQRKNDISFRSLSVIQTQMKHNVIKVCKIVSKIILVEKNIIIKMSELLMKEKINM